MAPITVIKRDAHGKETWRYTGSVLERGDHHIRLEARFNRPDLPFHGIVLGEGDLFLETFYSDRWYNIFEIHDRRDNHLKCWYCNIGFPAEIDHDMVSYRDLALDLLVYPDGKQLLLDEEEFEALNLEPEVKEKAWQAMEELQKFMKHDPSSSRIKSSK